MAKTTSKKAKAQSSENGENVVRIKAAPSKKSAKTEKVTEATVVAAEKPVKTKKSGKGVRGAGALRGIGGYFKGAWVELRQVRWPNRRATWSLTGAVLLYSAFFVVLVLLLDAAFKYLFELILGK